MLPDPNSLPYLELIEAESPIGDRFYDVQRLSSTGGDGQFSLVLRAIDCSTSSPVALKFFHPNKMNDSYRWECFQREARLLEEFQSKPDIVTLVVGISPLTITLQHSKSRPIPLTLYFYGTELAMASVTQYIVKGSWDFSQRLTAFRSMCRSVQRIHTDRIVHRDLKPDNFLVFDNNAIKLCDFGTARSITSAEFGLKSHYGAPVGDIRYVAPELIACLHDCDPAIAFTADIFSLGAILFELLTDSQLHPHIATERWYDIRHFVTLPVEKRVLAYTQFLHELESHVHIPLVRDVAPRIPPDLANLADRLCQSLTAVDFRKRPTDFQRTFNTLRRCISMAEGL